MCGWIKLSTLSGTQAFLLNAVDPVAGHGYQIGIMSGQLYVWSFGGGTLINTDMSINTWTHLAYTYNGSNEHSFILDGVVRATSGASTQSGQPTLCQVGGNQWAEYANAVQLEDIRTYNRVLSMAEIDTIRAANAQDGIVYGMASWLPMSEFVSGTVLSLAERLTPWSGLPVDMVGTSYPVAQDSVFLQRRAV